MFVMSVCLLCICECLLCLCVCYVYVSVHVCELGESECWLQVLVESSLCK